MTALDNIPENKNFLSPLGFKFQIKKSPHLNFFVQNVNIPGITLAPPTSGNPFVRLSYPGDHIQYDDIMVSFKVDEDLQNYLEIHNWIRDLGFPNKFDEYRRIQKVAPTTGLGIRSDISLIILSSAKNPIYDVTFKDTFPVSLSSLIFDTTSNDVNYIEASATFRYTSFDINLI